MSDAGVTSLLGLPRRLELRHRAWRWATKKDPDEIRWMKSVLTPGDVAIDAGAYKGGYLYTMRQQIGESGQVYAFEPQPELARFLGKAIKAFAWQNVHVEEAGLSDEPGKATLHASADGPSQIASLVPTNAEEDSRTYSVRLESIDAFVARQELAGRVSFIKCDVEGHELVVFQGAEETLRTHRPRLLFECENRHLPSGSVEEVFDFLGGLGYRGFFFRDGQQVDVSEFNADSDQVLGRDVYVNLFAFEADDDSTPHPAPSSL